MVCLWVVLAAYPVCLGCYSIPWIWDLSTLLHYYCAMVYLWVALVVYPDFGFYQPCCDFYSANSNFSNLVKCMKINPISHDKVVTFLQRRIIVKHKVVSLHEIIFLQKRILIKYKMTFLQIRTGVKFKMTLIQVLIMEKI